MNEDRRFGLVVGGAFALLGAVLLVLLHRRTTGGAFLAVGAVLLLLAFVAPALLALPHRAWMTFARLMARVNTALFLSVVFFLVLTPLAALLRLLGRDELLRRANAGSSTWVPYPERNRDPLHYEKMF